MVSLSLVVVITLVVIVAGAVNGIAGFGFAVVGTMALATVLPPATAVVFMIVPILGVNLRLVSDLSTTQLRTCGRRFAWFLASALVGTVIGMLVLERVPADPLRLGLGLVTLGFVATSQQVVPLPAFSRAKDRCFAESPAGMTGVGGVGGLLFGATNVGVQLVAYVRSCQLSHRLFVGVVAMCFVGLNGLRVVLGVGLGLYPTTAIALGSVAAAVPAVLGVAIGSRVRHRLTDARRSAIVLSLLTVIGGRLLVGGLGLV